MATPGGYYKKMVFLGAIDIYVMTNDATFTEHNYNLHNVTDQPHEEAEDDKQNTYMTNKSNK